jgi:hypothetical protein
MSDRITEEGETETHRIIDHEICDQDADKDDNDEEDAVIRTIKRTPRFRNSDDGQTPTAGR